MTNRREFLAQTAVAGIAGGRISMTESQLAGATESGAASASTPRDTALASKSLRILILGGTGFIGPHFVRAALERGHHVAVFNRGKDRADLPETVEHLIGDRNGDLDAIKNRDWNAVFDTAAYIPLWVRTLGQALQGRVKHYTFISTQAVYQFPGAIDESSPVQKYTGTADAYSAFPTPQYGPLKVLCEEEAERQFPGRTLVLRPAAMVGPRDPVGAFIYWPVRMQRGEEILVAGDPLAPVQVADVRDLVEWAVRMAEKAETGVFNAMGPAMPMGQAEMLGGIRAASSVPLTLTWVAVPWLVEQKLSPENNPLYWPTEIGLPGLWRLSNSRACAKGLTFRPLSITVADALAWYQSQPVERQKDLLLGLNGKSGIDDSMTREREILAAWRSRKRQGA
jgi:2'-hydroxyisoflavone reductase